MTSLSGFPDLASALDLGAATALAPFEGGSWTALPTGLQLTRRADGRPDLTLAKFRPERIGETPAAGGTLDFRLELVYDLAGALASARQVNPSATVAGAGATSGFLRLGNADSGAPALASLTAPAPVVWDGLDSGRFTIEISPDAASLFETMLRAGTVALSAHAELEHAGVAPRAPMQIAFDPSVLIAEIDRQIGQQGLVSRLALVGFLRKQPASIEILAGDWSDRAAAALADWIRARLLTPAPAPTLSTDTYLDLRSFAAGGSFIWDLSEPIVTWRAVVIQFDPLADVHAFVAEQGVDGLITEATIPSLPTGLNRVTVTANLPAVRPGLLELGVTLDAPPNPPWRMQERTATVVLEPSAEIAAPLLHLAPQEPLRYDSITYAALEGADELRGPSTSRGESTLRLHMDDFPVEFFIVKASAALLALCTVHLTFQPGGATQSSVPADLLDVQPSVAFSQPAGVSGAQITAELRPHDRSPPILLGPVPAARWALDLASCPTYGPQQAEISLTFEPGATDYEVELVPEGAPQTPDTITVYRFTPGHDRRTYTYASSSPFHGGYRWREYHPVPPLADWLLVSPSAPLELVAAPATATSAGATA